MASTLRLSSSAFRATLRAPSFTARTTAFNAVRCYSSSKSQVGNPPVPIRLITSLPIGLDSERAVCRVTSRED